MLVWIGWFSERKSNNRFIKHKTFEKYIEFIKIKGKIWIDNQ